MRSIRTRRPISRAVSSFYRSERLEDRCLLAAISSGQTLAGAISVASEVDDYTFTAAVGETAVVAAAETTAGSALSLRVQLIAPAGTILLNTTTTTGTGGIVTSLPAAGTYTIRLTDTSTNTGGYNVSLAKLGGTHVAGGDDGAITSGQYVTASAGIGDIDIFTLNGVAGGSLSLAAGELLGQTFLTQVSVYSPTGAQLYNVANDTQATSLVTLPSTGTYHIVVHDSGFNDVGNYNLTAVVTPGTQIVDVDSGALTSGLRRAGNIDAGDLDVYTITTPINGTLVFTVTETAGNASFNPYVQVFSPTGVRLVNTAPATGVTDLIASTVAGTYTIVIADGSGDATGSYALTAVTVPSTQPTDADSGPTQSGQARLGAIDTGDLDVYTINATAGGILAYAVADTDPSGFDVGIILLGPSGVVLNNTAGAETTSGVQTNLTSTGTYTVIVYDQFGDETGNYRLTVAAAPGTPIVDADSGTLASGVRRTGTTDLADIDIYTLTAPANGNILLTFSETTTNPSYAPNVYLISPTGALLQNVAGQTGNALLQAAATTGTYQVWVFDQSHDEVGGYALTATLAPATQPVDSDSGPIASGFTANGTITLGDTDVYTISANAGSSLLFNHADTLGDAFNPQIVVFGPTGATLTNIADPTANVGLLSNLAATGTYTFAVFDSFADSIGTYALTVVAAPAPAQPTDVDSGPLTSAAQRTGTLTLGDIDVFTVALPIGGSLLYAMSDPGLGAFAPQVLIFSPTGVVLSNVAGQVGSTALISSVAAAGTYVVAILDQFGNDTGDYAGTFVFAPAAQAADSESGPTASAEYRRGDIDLGDIDVFTIPVTAGQDILITASESNYLGAAGLGELGMIVFSPTGTVLENTSNAIGRAVRLANAPSTGTYTIAIFDSSADEINVYGLTATTLTSTAALSGDSGAIVSGELKRGRIDYGDTDVYTFTGAVNQSVAIFLTDMNGDAFAPAVYVVAPDGTLLIATSGAAGVATSFSNFTQTGIYRIVIWHSGGDDVGEYGLTMTLSNSSQPATGDSGPIASLATRTGVITAGDADIYTFNATAGVNFTVNLAETQASGFDPGIIIYRPNGTLQSFTSGATTASLTASSVVAGTYTIVVYDVTSDETGSYSIGLNTAAGTDAVPPTISEAAYRYDDVSPSVALYATEDIATTFAATDLELTNLTTATVVPVTSLIVSYDPSINKITVSPAGLPGGVLSDGNYRLRIAGGSIGDGSGNNQLSNFDFNFHVLQGDLDRDKDVDFTDLLTLVQNYDKIGRPFSRGNLDYDTGGSVNFTDLLSQVQRFNTSLPIQATSRKPLFGELEIL